MKAVKPVLYIALLTAALSHSVTIQAGWGDFIKQQLDTLDTGSKGDSAVKAVLSNDEVIAGLKQALEKGTEYAVKYLGKTDGFFANPSVKIPMPEKLANAPKVGHLPADIG